MRHAHKTQTILVVLRVTRPHVLIHIELLQSVPQLRLNDRPIVISRLIHLLGQKHHLFQMSREQRELILAITEHLKRVHIALRHVDASGDRIHTRTENARQISTIKDDVHNTLVVDQCCLRDLRSPHISNLSPVHDLSTRLIVISNHHVMAVMIHVHQDAGIVHVAHHVADELTTTVIETVGDKVERTRQLSRGEVETLAFLRRIGGKQRCQLLALDTRVRSDRQVTHAIDVPTTQIIDDIIEDLQRCGLQKNAVVHRQVGSAILDLSDRLLNFSRHLRCLTTRRFRAILTLLLLFETIEALRRLDLVLEPGLSHARDLLKQNRRHILRQIGNEVHTPERRELITGALIVEVAQDTPDVPINLEVVRVEHIALTRLHCQEMCILLKRCTVGLSKQRLALLTRHTLETTLLRRSSIARFISSNRGTRFTNARRGHAPRR